jgi:DNA topoisomerase-3
MNATNRSAIRAPIAGICRRTWARTLPGIVKTIELYRQHLLRTGERPLTALRGRFRSLTITPSFPLTSPERVSLPPDERKVYDLICRRPLSARHEDHIWSVTVITRSAT